MKFEASSDDCLPENPCDAPGWAPSPGRTDAPPALWRHRASTEAASRALSACGLGRIRAPACPGRPHVVPTCLHTQSFAAPPTRCAAPIPYELMSSWAVGARRKRGRRERGPGGCGVARGDDTHICAGALWWSSLRGWRDPSERSPRANFIGAHVLGALFARVRRTDGWVGERHPGLGLSGSCRGSRARGLHRQTARNLGGGALEGCGEAGGRRFAPSPEGTRGGATPRRPRGAHSAAQIGWSHETSARRRAPRWRRPGGR